MNVETMVEHDNHDKGYQSNPIDLPVRIHVRVGSIP